MNPTTTICRTYVLIAEFAYTPMAEFAYLLVIAEFAVLDFRTALHYNLINVKVIYTVVEN